MMARFAPGDLVRARGREWVALPPPRPGLLALRPLSGSEPDVVVLDPALERTPVAVARFDLPATARCTVQTRAALLAEALRLTLRRGAGPFRAAAWLTFEPRTYQLVPLLMALRLAVPRLLIADDVGIGKTIEAGLILRELLDRGEAQACAVLCPPPLVDQWVTELATRFGIEAVAVTAGTAARLERRLPLDRTLFDAHPFTVVSLDYIKADKRREGFAQACPDFVIVDEAHACVGTHSRGRQQRFALLQRLAQDRQRRLVMLTATPHSGDAAAFTRLLSLLDPEAFAAPDFGDPRDRARLARHFVQRRRIDLTGDWREDSAFPEHETAECPYRLSPPHRAFQEAVLDYGLTVVAQAGTGRQERRLAFLGTLALLRCAASSPAAARRALRHRAANRAADQPADQMKRLEPHIHDGDDEDEAEGDIEPGTVFTETVFTDDPALRALLAQADALAGATDPKCAALVAALRPLLRAGASPVVFCRYLATADHVRDRLRKAFPQCVVEAVTGALTPDERRARVAAMAPGDGPADGPTDGPDDAPGDRSGDDPAPRILVATDCLSEGINLQQLFDTVVHYDLSWNPTRHQQREGRVDRFGQPAKRVRSIMMFSPDSAIDGAVLGVILRKAEDIRKATGVTVPLPEDRGPVTEALMAAMLLQRRDRAQLVLDFSPDDSVRAMEARWRDAHEQERKSRTRFAQHAMQPAEVAPEWARASQLLGSPADAARFVERAMAGFGVPLDPRESRRGCNIAHLHALPAGLWAQLQQRGLARSVRLATTDPAPPGATRLTRTHPLTVGLAESLVEAALDEAAAPDAGLGRVGAWPTAAVTALTRVALLRLRYKLTVHARQERLLLAEEAALVALEGPEVVATDAAARAMLDAPATADLAPRARDRMIAAARADLPGLLAGPLATVTGQRAETLAEDHARLRAAAGPVSRVSVAPARPPDVIGLFVLVPAAG